MNNYRCLVVRGLSPLVLAVVAAALAVYGLALTGYLVRYIRPDYRDLLFLTQCGSENAVIEHFGRMPEIVYHKGDVMPQLGWRLPSRKISSKVMVYTNRSALRFYVYVDENGQVEYVFTSNS